ncbi:hypothetical protein PIB30_043151 [Stylosanthes scabra]|uniref:Glycosyltransferase n=1 Tax=Stylosanthes scabra TaxID=79078 RepID=A0ABU6ZE60_9FABA|nr:hypothetical protein [Stylosanthes scabra]
MADEQKELHVLLVALSAQGHINPLLRFGKSLLTRGLHVTLATTELVYDRVFKKPTDDDTVPASITVNGIHVVFFSDGFASESERKSTTIDDFMETLGKSGPANLSNIIKDHFLSSSFKKLACIINNPFVPWVADVAAEFQIPCACLWIQPCALYTIYYRFHNNLNPFPTHQDPTIQVHLPGLPLLQPQDLPSFIHPSNTFGVFQKLLSQMLQFQHMKKLKWILANSFYELEKDVIDSMAEIFPIKPVGPLVPPSLLLGSDENAYDVGIEMWKPQDSCMEWLDQKPPSSVIYISFGSLVELSENQWKNIADALVRSKRPFLWVMKRKDVSVQDQAKIPSASFLEETKEQGMVVPWCPQTKVLAHDSVACFLTHCGWNSMLEAITVGVPMIAYPQWTDQPTNAKLISEVFGTGIRLRQDDGKEFVATEEVERAIQEIFEGPRAEEIRKNAKGLKKEARDAVAEGGSSDRNIQSFVDEIVKENNANLTDQR